MALTFAKYEREESSLVSNGTVLSAVGKDGFVGLIPKNFNDPTKRVVVILRKKNGTSCQITCSKQVSDGLRNKSITTGMLMNFEILENEDGVNFISLPGGGIVETAVKDIKLQDYVPAAVSLEDLIA